MVKNTTGGNKSKGQARSSFTPKQTNTLRVSTDPCEIYCQVTKLLGDGMCHVSDLKKIIRLCHIRGKFRGRGKRDNFINIGSWILIGIREWETVNEKKMQNCDLLEVYSDSDIKKLQNIVGIDWSVFSLQNLNTTENNVDTKNNIEIKFSNESSYYDFEMNEKSEKVGNEKSEKVGIKEEDEEINIDDI